MKTHIWREIDAGMMMWEPTSEVIITQAVEEQPQHEQSPAATEQDLQGFLASNCDHTQRELTLPPYEDVFGTSLDIEPWKGSLFFESPDSSSPSEREGSTQASHCSSSASSWLHENNHTPKPDGIGLSNSQGSSSSFASNSIESYSTPCPRRMAPNRTGRNLLYSGGTSRSKSSNTARGSQSVPRKLTLTMSDSSDRVTPVSSSRDLSNLQSLAALRRIERAPSHSWDEDQRELLTILYRWYDDSNPTTLPRVFNHVTGLDLRVSVVRHQFEGHVLLFGGRAFPEYARVMAIPFHDPQGRYNAIRGIIEETAIDLGVSLQRREIEIAFNSGAARWAKSPRTRRLYRSLVRRAAQKEKEKGRISRLTQSVVLSSDQQAISMSECLLGNVALSTDNQEEKWSDVENPSPRAASVKKLRSLIEPIKRNIAFRVWDKNSRTPFSEEDGFVSQAFSIWRGEHPPPFTPDGEGRAALKLLTNLHLCLKGGASTFVSLSTSLLQALVKASTMDDPCIAIVALDDLSLTTPNKTLPAADVLRMLKSEGQAWWARYKGHAERMVWASVPAEAILHHFPIADLHTVAQSDPICSQLLNLSAFQPRRRTRHVSDRMREQRNTITTHTVQAVAGIARAFGMHRERVSLVHIQGFIAALVDSFQLRYDETGDAHANSISHNFAVTLRSRCHRIEDVALAFLEGARQGNDVIAYYSRRRS